MKNTDYEKENRIKAIEVYEETSRLVKTYSANGNMKKGQKVINILEEMINEEKKRLKSQQLNVKEVN
jgi:hypothetical protein